MLQMLSPRDCRDELVNEEEKKLLEEEEKGEERKTVRGR